MNTELAVTGLEIYAHHGLFAEEAALGQRFRLDVSATLSASASHADDNLTHSIRYDTFITEIETVMLGPRFNTLEALAEAIARRLFVSFALVDALTVSVAKLAPPLRQTVDRVAIEVRLRR